MKINIEKSTSNKINKNEINIKIEVPSDYTQTEKLIDYIKEYEKFYAISGYELQNINLNEILYFYSDKKYNYCKTINKEFQIKSKLYELEKISMNFFRISKSCVINMQQVKCFDLGETGKITIKFFDNSEQVVARRKIRELMDYLDGRRI